MQPLSTHAPVLVLGATGFVGRHVVAALTDRGAPPNTMKAPRLDESTSRKRLVRQLAQVFASFPAVVNAAGVAHPTGRPRDMHMANAVLPGVLSEAADLARARLIHVSSAAVQGRREPLDSTLVTAPTSPYSFTKAAGEVAVLSHAEDCVIFRPAGVHGAERSVTRTLVKYARSRIAAVASPGTANTPQALARNVGDAIAYLALSEKRPPSIVHHPSEGLTTASLLELLSGVPPLRLPRLPATTIPKGLQVMLPENSRINGLARRLEVLLVGQKQAPSWLDAAGWSRPSGHAAWAELGTTIVQTGDSK